MPGGISYLEVRLDNSDFNFFREFLEWCDEHGILWLGDDVQTEVHGPDGWKLVIPKGTTMADCYPGLVTFVSLYEEGLAPHVDVPISQVQLRSYNDRQKLSFLLGLNLVCFRLTRQERWMN